MIYFSAVLIIFAIVLAVWIFKGNSKSVPLIPGCRYRLPGRDVWAQITYVGFNTVDYSIQDGSGGVLRYTADKSVFAKNAKLITDTELEIESAMQK